VVTRHSFCRRCLNSCPTLVEVVDGRLVAVRGDPANELFGGYSCIKGQTEPDRHNHPDRLLHTHKRRPDGGFEPIGSADAIDEIAGLLSQIVEESGPRAVATYVGTGVAGQTLAHAFTGAFMEALGSGMLFTPNTIDKPGKNTALAMHGRWGAPLQGYHDPKVALLVGTNPFKTYYGAAAGNPGRWLRERIAAGMQLLVIDPRRSDVARIASLHLQPYPGHDPAILACLAHVIIEERLYDANFVDENARGLGALRAAVAAFTPEAVAARAGVAADDLLEVARRFASAGRGYIACGVGPGFAKSSTLVEYLALVLETLCGHWMREGEAVLRTTTILPSGPFVAQAYDPTPAYGFGEAMRVGGLGQTVAGMPTGALADEILLPGDGRVRALLSFGGNPVLSWPDQAKTIEALRQLDLFVQVDPWMSASSRLAHYVVAPTMFYETPGMTTVTDNVISIAWRHCHYGPDRAHSQYTEAVIAPPEGSDLLSEWQLLYRLAQRLGLSLCLAGHSADGGRTKHAIGMGDEPTEADLLELVARGGRVPLAEVKRHPSGASIRDPLQIVAPREPGWRGRFDLANEDMLRDLASELDDGRHGGGPGAGGRSFRLISIRAQHMNNSTLNDRASNRGKFHNPAFMHPDDMRELGLSDGDVVELISRRATVRAIVEADAALRPGLVGTYFGFGDAPERDGELREIGTAVGRLLDGSDIADPYVGMPRIGNIEVELRAVPG
jgi:anaerobic selenocysteine-containing dehydrogenase